jgi:hypothetical protein
MISLQEIWPEVLLGGSLGLFWVAVAHRWLGQTVGRGGGSFARAFVGVFAGQTLTFLALGIAGLRTSFELIPLLGAYGFPVIGGTLWTACRLRG